MSEEAAVDHSGVEKLTIQSEKNNEIIKSN